MNSILSIGNYLMDRVVSVAEWINLHNDFVTAAATAAIAFFTLTLYLATRKLWKVSQEQSRDMKKSLRIAQEAADAAKRSANALPAIERAYLFVEVTMENPDREGIAGTLENESVYNPGNVKIIVTNHGKTPAIVIARPFTTEVLTVDEIDNKIAIFASNNVDNWPQIGPEIINGDTRLDPIPSGFMMNDIRWQRITTEEAFLACFGCFHYKDIFGEIHKTVFCWKYEESIGFHYDKAPKRNDQT